MNIWMSRSGWLVLLIGIACSGAPPAQPPTPPPSQAVQPPVPAAEVPPKSEALARADALLEDLKRRQEAQEKYDREHPLPPAPPLPGSVVAVGPPAAVDPAARDENWWKDRMRSLELALNEKEIKLAAAERANLKSGGNDALAEYQKIVAEVGDARQAIERLRDEATRAGVPSSWLK
jgi:hypothetical protein